MKFSPAIAVAFFAATAHGFSAPVTNQVNGAPPAPTTDKAPAATSKKEASGYTPEFGNGGRGEAVHAGPRPAPKVISMQDSLMRDERKPINSNSIYPRYYDVPSRPENTVPADDKTVISHQDSIEPRSYSRISPESAYPKHGHRY